MALVAKIKYIAEDINIDNNSKKYINFLRSFENYKFWNKNKNEILLWIYEIYSTPQKLNNIFLLFLIYFYYHLKNLLKDVALLKIIDVYYYIIYFRNKNQLNLTQPYIYSKIFNQNEKLDTILFSRYNKILISTVFLILILLSFFTIWDYQANILSNNEMLSKLFVDTFVFWMPTYDTVYDSVKWTISLYYIILVVILVSFLQIIKAWIQENLFGKIFTYIKNIVKTVFSIIFYPYFFFWNYFWTNLIYKFNYFNEYLWKKWLDFSKILLVTTIVIILFITFLLVLIYIIFFSFFFAISLNFFEITYVAFFISILIFLYDLLISYNNFTQFNKKLDKLMWYINDN